MKNSKMRRQEKLGSKNCMAGTVKQAKKTEMPLQGISYVAISSPNISMSPGPMMVSMPLSLKPSKKYMSIKFHFLRQNNPNILQAKSMIMSRKRVVLKPNLSPIAPQKGAPMMAATVSMIEQQARQWSSLMSGMKISFMQRTKYIRQSGVRKEIVNRMRNLLSFRACLSVRVSLLLLSTVDEGKTMTVSLFDSGRLLSGCSSSTNFGPMVQGSSRLEISIEPTRKQNPLHRNMIFEAFTISSVIQLPKNACLCWVISASMLCGLTILVKTRFHTIIPDEKKSTAAPETLFRSLGNCDQRQFRMGMELIAKQVMGMKRKNRPMVKTLSQMLMRKGDRLNMSPHVLMTCLQPKQRVKRVERSMSRAEGTMEQSMMAELVRGVISAPWLWRYEKKQMLMEPQMPMTPVANLISAVPMSVRVAVLSAFCSMASIANNQIIVIVIVCFPLSDLQIRQSLSLQICQISVFVAVCCVEAVKSSLTILIKLHNINQVCLGYSLMLLLYFTLSIEMIWFRTTRFGSLLPSFSDFYVFSWFEISFAISVSIVCQLSSEV